MVSGCCVQTETASALVVHPTVCCMCCRWPWLPHGRQWYHARRSNGPRPSRTTALMGPTGRAGASDVSASGRVRQLCRGGGGGAAAGGDAWRERTAGGIYGLLKALPLHAGLISDRCVAGLTDLECDQVWFQSCEPPFVRLLRAHPRHNATTSAVFAVPSRSLSQTRTCGRMVAGWVRQLVRV
jgi:hypothetical protein